MDQFNFKPSKLFKASKIIHPATVISVFYGYPLPPENETGLINLLDFLLGTNTPHDLLTPTLFQNLRQKTLPYLKGCFPELCLFSERHSAELANNLNNVEYKSKFLTLIESSFGNQLGVTKMDPDYVLRNNVKQQRADSLDPIDAIINAHRPAQIYRTPKFLPPFYLHKDREENTEENKTTLFSHTKLAKL